MLIAIFKIELFVFFNSFKDVNILSVHKGDDEMKDKENELDSEMSMQRPAEDCEVNSEQISIDAEVADGEDS